MNFDEAHNHASFLALSGIKSPRLTRSPNGLGWVVRYPSKGSGSDVVGQKKEDDRKSPLVGYYAKGKRLIVHDPSVQPRNPNLILIYSVHGHSLCVRNRVTDEPKLSYHASQIWIDFALDQYVLWCRANEQELKIKQATDRIDNLPGIQTKCPSCDGMGTWMDRVNKCSYGVIEEESNIVEHCQKCHGHGFIDDFL